MAAKTLPSAQLLRQLLTYDPQTGELHWKRRPRELFTSDRVCNAWNIRWAGKPAFTAVNAQGYLVGNIDRSQYRAHRIAWSIQTGAEAPAQIDHIDHCTTNNKWGNLRAACYPTNAKNKSMSTKNTSGVTGVHWAKRERKWVAQIQIRGKNIGLGCHKNFARAVSARRAAEIEYDFHHNHGKGTPIIGLSCEEQIELAAELGSIA